MEQKVKQKCLSIWLTDIEHAMGLAVQDKYKYALVYTSFFC